MFMIISKRKYDREKMQLDVSRAVVRDKEKALEAEQSSRMFFEEENLELKHQLSEQERRMDCLEDRVRYELWKKVHAILTEPKGAGKEYPEHCGCYRNPDTGKWEVVVGCSFYDGDDAERVVFDSPEDAHRYYALLHAFEQYPWTSDFLEVFAEPVKELENVA
ncbi:MAG: hypothetical protein LUI87_12780 [Lachnospiraceae bacterium]|nr:hypothetical protein [Lachnospiraceae bacterium]